MVYIRKITRKWKTKDGEEKEKSYYYWYKSRRIGEEVISECFGRASEKDYKKTLKKKIVIPKKQEMDDLSIKRPTVVTI